MGFGMKKMLLGVAVGGVLAMGGVANAAPTDLTTLIAYGPLPAGASNNLTDQNGEGLIKGVGNTNAGVIQQGDFIYGVFDYNRIYNNNHAYPGEGMGGNSGYTELTGVFLIEVITKTPAAGGTFNFTFGANAAKMASTFGITVANLGTMVRLFDDPSLNFTLGVSSTIAQSINSAKDGTQLVDVGFTGAGGNAALGEGWAVVGGSDNFASLMTLPIAYTAFGTSNFALDRTNTTGFVGGLNLVKQDNTVTQSFGGKAEFVGSSTIKGVLDPTGSPITVWGGSSQTNISFIAAVPVPTAAFMGLPLLALMGGVAALRRRTARLV